MKRFLTFETTNLTRPIALLLQNIMMFTYFKTNGVNEEIIELLKNGTGKEKNGKYSSVKIDFLNDFSLINELQFIKWRLKK